jgi:hypothetical protein
MWDILKFVFSTPASLLGTFALLMAICGITFEFLILFRDK